MNKKEIIFEIMKYYPSKKGKDNISNLNYYETSEIKRLKNLLREKHDKNEEFLNIPKWFVLNKWPKPIFTRQANIPDPIWPYFSIWIHDIVNGNHYTISCSHIIPFFLIYKWKNMNIPKEGFDYFENPLIRKDYFNDLVFEGFNPDTVAGIHLKEIEYIYTKYLNSSLFKNIEILDDVIPEIYFEGRTEKDFLIRDIFDGVTKHKINKPYLDELGSGLI